MWLNTTKIVNILGQHANTKDFLTIAVVMESTQRMIHF